MKKTKFCLFKNLSIKKPKIFLLFYSIINNIHSIQCILARNTTFSFGNEFTLQRRSTTTTNSRIRSLAIALFWYDIGGIPILCSLYVIVHFGPAHSITERDL